jgi:hypothetical protein
MEEIHGSSDIYKLANNVITFGQVYEVNGDRAPTNATGFQVLKARWSLGMGYIGLVTFNWKVKEYASTYSLLKVKDRWATKVEWVDYSSKPFWAQSMVERSYV